MTRDEYRGCRELEIGMLDNVYSDLDLLTLPEVEQRVHAVQDGKAIPYTRLGERE